MSFIDGLRHRLHVLIHSDEHARELAEELDFHMGLEQMQQEHVAGGTGADDDTRRVARRVLGNVTYYKEETRRTAGLGLLDDLRSDVRFAFRTFRQAPGFSAIAVLTLALGIGANTAIFSVVDALMLRPLPFPEPDRLMTVTLTSPARDDRPARSNIPWSYAKFIAMRDAQRVFSSVAAFLPTQFTVRVGDEAERLSGEFIDSQYLRTLGLSPALGRGLLPEEDHIGGPRVALLSDAMWQGTFNADPQVLGRPISVDGTPYTIVGVMPRGFAGLDGDVAFWIPLNAGPSESWQTELTRSPWNHLYPALGRLRPGVSAEQATAAMQQIGVEVDAQFPAPQNVAGLHLGATARPLDAVRVDGRIRRTLFVLVGAVGLVLLIACANVANLCLVRAAGRRREIAVRLAIGAGRGRLVRQMLAESLVLAGVGGIASIAVAWWGAKALASIEVARMLRLQSVLGLLSADAGMRLDMSAFAFTAALAIATGVLFGVVPAIQATRFSVTNALKDEVGSGGGPRRLSGRNALVVAEIALAIVLLAGSGLMVRSLGELLAVRPGFDPQHVLTLRVNRAPDWARDSIDRFFDAAVQRLSALPGVTSVGVGDCPPLTRGCYGRAELTRPDIPSGAPGTRPIVGVHWITPEWPTAIRVPLVRGRLFTRADDARARKVVLVSESAARRLWPNEDPIDRPVRLDVNFFHGDTAYVAGVIGDLRFGSLDSLPQPDVYISYYQSPMTYRMMFFVRTQGDPNALVTAARRTIRDVAPGFPVYDMMSMESRVTEATAHAQFSAMVLTVCAGLALALAAIGTYGVISFAVAQRTKEIGIRVAMGATTSDVVRLVVGQGISLAIVGIVIGLAGAIGATRVLRSLLYGVEPTDPATLFGIVAMLIVAVLAASWIPARRAAGVPAVHALRGK